MTSEKNNWLQLQLWMIESFISQYAKTKELDNTTSHKLLGVYIDQDLSFNEHVEKLCKKLTKRIGLLRSIRQYLPLNERILFYNTTIKPVFLYGGAVWSSTSKCNIRRIFRLQPEKSSSCYFRLKNERPTYCDSI